MNLRQLHFLCQLGRSGFNVTSTAQAVHVTQPGISKQLSALERELGVDILLRRGNRIVGLTAPGSAILEVAGRMLNDARTIRAISEEFGQQDRGRLIVATTHTHARYVLPDVVQKYSQMYPKVQLVMRQENATRVAELVSTGEADIGISAQPEEPPANLLMFPCYRLARSLFMPVDHPLARKRNRLTLEEICRYPLITLDASFAAGRKVLHTFARAGLRPSVVMSATDTEVVKWYVGIKLGIAILPTIAYEPRRDRVLRVRDAGHLFESNVACLMLRRNHYLLRYMAEFTQLLARHWNKTALERALQTGKVPDFAFPTYPIRKPRAVS